MTTSRRQPIQEGRLVKMRLKESYQLNYGTTSTTTPTPTPIRSWDDMNYEILLNIMSRLPWPERLFIVCLVSKTWLSAVLDSMSHPGVIDLKLMDSPKLKYGPNRFTIFLKHRLNGMPSDSCFAFYQGVTFLKPHKYSFIAKRTPSMQKMIIHRTVGAAYNFIEPAIRHWKKLKDVQCPARLILVFRNNFTKVETLRLFGVVDDAIAAIIRDKCPRLRRLRLNECALSVNASSTILDGHKKLELLDTCHSFRVPDCRDALCSRISQTLEWNEEEIRRKAVGVKVHLKCARERCSKCAVPMRKLFPEAKSHVHYHPLYCGNCSGSQVSCALPSLIYQSKQMSVRMVDGD